MSHSDPASLQKTQPEEGVPLSFRSLMDANHLMALVVILGVLALGLRAISLRRDIGETLVNPALLKAAMQAAAGTPVSATEAAEVLSNRGAVSAFQARAMSRIAARAEQWTTAEAWLAQGVGDADAGYLAQFELCRLYWGQGRRDYAREACRDTDSSAYYWLNRGYVADQNGERAEALAAFQMATTVDPKLTVAWQQLGHALFASGRYGEAILAYERVMALNPTPPADIFHSLSRAYLETGNLTMVRDVVNRGLMIYPMERVLYLVMADSYRQESDLETAESWYVRMLQRWPYDASIWARRGEVAAAAGRLRDAEEYYQEAVAIQPDDVGYWTGLATTAVAGDNKPLARDAYQKAMVLRPDDAALWLEAGRYFAEAGWASDARAAFERVLELEPDNTEALDRLAELDGQ